MAEIRTGRTEEMTPWRLPVLAAVLALAIGASGCVRMFGSPQAADEDVQFARSFLALFGARSIAAIEMGMDPAGRDPQLRLKTLQMASIVPTGTPSAVHLVASNITGRGETRRTSMSFQYQYPDRYLLADIVVERKAGAPVVTGVQIRPLAEPLERVNRFTFAGKGRAHYAALAAAAAVIAFVLWTFVVALRTPVPGPKPLWLLFVLVGFVEVVFNWSTGTWSVAPTGIQPLGSWLSKASPFAPLFVTTSIPVGAIVFLVQRREWMEDDRGLEGDARGEVPPSTGDAPP
jgi:hypothetical protein